MLDDLTISVLFEREIDGENVPEPVGIQAANRKTYRQLNDKLRAAQQHAEQRLGSAPGTEWIRFIPSFLLRSFVRLASRNIGTQKRFGVVGTYYQVSRHPGGVPCLLPGVSAFQREQRESHAGIAKTDDSTVGIGSSRFCRFRQAPARASRSASSIAAASSCISGMACE